jgi:hypothetical protein
MWADFVYNSFTQLHCSHIYYIDYKRKLVGTYPGNRPFVFLNDNTLRSSNFELYERYFKTRGFKFSLFLSFDFKLLEIATNDLMR